MTSVDGARLAFDNVSQRPLTAIGPSSPFRLRHLTPADAPAMAGLLQRLSPESRYWRFLRLVRSFTEADAARLVAEGPHHLAVGAFAGQVLIGAAHYFRPSKRSECAEVAVEVADSHHRRGVGAGLLEELARLAADSGITSLTATILTENHAVLDLIRHSGWGIDITPDGAYADLVITLDTASGGRGLQATVSENPGHR